ncbi:hypothetical protein [Rhizobium sp. CIAT894]|uniref:hypothetical protein n=1 Tax=Rhizobium sp. CIAT894 TaxID=2020312 RepID=UPI000F739980|nr:hypothetical protein [Rhizobium sp. CIAT894]
MASVPARFCARKAEITATSKIDPALPAEKADEMPQPHKAGRILHRSFHPPRRHDLSREKAWICTAANTNAAKKSNIFNEKILVTERLTCVARPRQSHFSPVKTSL